MIYKALTLHQPWASLIALGVKTIETRSWSTKYRGPLAIHAGKRGLRLGGVHVPTLKRDGSHEEQDAWNGQTWFAINTITDPAFQGLQPQGKRIPKRAQTPTLFWPTAGPHHRPRGEYTHTELLPLGAVVATCTLAAIVPTSEVIFGPDGTLGDRRWGVGDNCAAVVEDEARFGDYTSGRFAWLLSDIEPLAEPMPARGRQGLWEWSS